MRRVLERVWAVAAVGLMVSAAPALAQHGGGGHGGGFSGHAGAEAARGSFSGGGQFRYTGGALRQGYRPAARGFAPGPGLAVTAPIGGGGASGARPASYNRGGYGRWRYGRAGGVPYIYPGVYSGWDGYELGSLDDDGDYDNDTQAYSEGPADGYGPEEGYDAGYGPGYPAEYGPGDGPTEGYPGPAEGFGGQPPEQPQQTSEESAQESAAALAQNTSPSLYDAAEVTLVFKDGRPPEKIQNYALTRTTLYVTGDHHREIPVSALDLAATEKANRDAGVAFQLPQGQ